MTSSDLQFYKDKRIFITGHTGFKGSWMCRVLLNAGAQVIGYSSCSENEIRLFDLCGIKDQITHIKGDVRDLAHLKEAFHTYQPEIVVHMAAQPIVRTSYEQPVETYETNVMGTVNLLECVRTARSPVRSVLNVTTDKVYQNNEWCWGYRENEPLDGFDPYSNSKSCSELVTHSFVNSFFRNSDTAVSTARAGNVIGGGDFARDRIIPDCVRAAVANNPIIVRNPNSTRPYQHVLEPVMAYLMIAQQQYMNKEIAGWYNVGPDECDCVTTGELVDLFCTAWGCGACWENHAEANAPHEANFLKLDCTKLKTTFGWSPKWHIDEAIEKTVEWSKCWQNGGDIPSEMDQQIKAYLGES